MSSSPSHSQTGHAAVLQTAPAHVHVAILDAQYLSFGGDGDQPAASVSGCARCRSVHPAWTSSTVVTKLASIKHLATLCASPSDPAVCKTVNLCFFAGILQVTIKAADASINKDVRKALVAGFSKAVPQAVSTLTGDRLYMTFEDIPVQNFAVGDSIMTFDTMHT